MANLIKKIKFSPQRKSWLALWRSRLLRSLDSWKNMCKSLKKCTWKRNMPVEICAKFHPWKPSPCPWKVRKKIPVQMQKCHEKTKSSPVKLNFLSVKKMKKISRERKSGREKVKSKNCNRETQNVLVKRMAKMAKNVFHWHF